MKLISPPILVRNLFKKIIWDLPNNENRIFLTFDDCSDEDLTFWVLDILKEYKLTGTFFPIGKYLLKNNLNLIINKEGHEIGNHTFDHLNGFYLSKNEYLENVLKSEQILKTNLFRPPYGKIKSNQLKVLVKKFKIIMWSNLTYDFDNSVSPLECYQNSIKNISSGSIIVFHTNTKSTRNIKYALPCSIEYLLKNNFSMNSSISENFH